MLFKSKVSFMFVLNEKTSDKTVFQYTCREPFKGQIEQEGSYLKVKKKKAYFFCVNLIHYF